MTKAQILIVEDDRIVAEDIQSSLQNLGYTVSAIAPSGAEALVRVKEGNPDLVLMDIVLKGKMNGIEAADQIRSQFDIPVVYLTAYADEELLDQARITEPFGYILKPFEERELNTVIEIALYKHKMEKRLREGEKQWKSITENSPDYIMTLDPDANILFVNHTLSELTREQVIGSSFYDYALPGYKEVAEDCFEGVLKTGKPGGFESVYEDPNGNLHFFESYVGPVLRSGKVVGLTVSSRDVTERKRAEVALQESEEKYRSMMEAMTDSVYICSPDFRVEYMNTSMIRRTGRDATGKLCYKAINDFEEKCPWCVHETIQKGEHAETEIVSPQDGHTYNVSHSPMFHVDGSISKMTIYRDVTQHKRAEDALRNSERELSIRNRIAETFLITSDEETYGKVLEVVLEAMRSKYGTFAYINENGDRVVPSMTRDIWDECQVRDKNIVFPRETWGNNLWAKCLIEKKAISSNGPFRVPDGHIPVTRVLTVPIIYQGEAIGNFMVGNKATDYDEADEELLKRIAAHTAPILHARLEKDTQHRKRERAEEALLRARDTLEQRVKERTADLATANKQLRQEIEVRKRAEEKEARQRQRLEVLWKVARMIDEDYQVLCDSVLEETMAITQSQYAFYGFLNEDGSVMNIYSWSKETMEACQIQDKPFETPIASAGLWGDAVRQRKPLIINDYQGDHPSKKGLPEGHVRLTRLLVVPVFTHNRMVAVAAVANKASDYTIIDARQIEAFATNVQVIMDRKRSEEELDKSEAELRHLSAQLLEVQENERKRLSRELHDSTGQLLAALKFGMENALDKMRHGTIGESVELLETVIPLAQQAGDEVRRIHTDLRPSLIDDLGIVATISWFCREFETLHASVRIEQMILTDEKEVPEPLKIVIFRILQEALNNVAKYGKAGRVRVSLRQKDGKLELAIEDNGQGFDVEYVRSEKNADRGVGLTSMKERAELSGGSFSIESKKGAGTTVRASWPDGSEASIS